MRPRSASEWRSFWRHGGEDALAAVLGSIWPPLGTASGEERDATAERFPLLLDGSIVTKHWTSEVLETGRRAWIEPDVRALP